MSPQESAEMKALHDARAHAGRTWPMVPGSIARIDRVLPIFALVIISLDFCQFPSNKDHLKA